MGCELTKLVGKKEHQEEYEVPLPEPPPPAPPDPRLPLTARQKFSLTKSWKAINRAMEPTGVTMFLQLFEDNIQLLTFFEKFKNLKSRDQQAQSLELSEHATVVMNSIDEGIRAMDNVDFFFDLLHQIGASHRKIQGFKKDYFWKIEKPFLEAVKITLDERYTENISKVYKITIKFIIETVIEGYDHAEEREMNDNETSATNYDDKKSATKVSPTTPPANETNKQAIEDAIVNIKCSANTSFFQAKANLANSNDEKMKIKKCPIDYS